MRVREDILRNNEEEPITKKTILQFIVCCIIAVGITGRLKRLLVCLGKWGIRFERLFRYVHFRFDESANRGIKGTEYRRICRGNQS